MDLLPFTRRGSDGRLDTEIYLSEPQHRGPMEVSVDQLVGSFGSIHNGGLSRLIQFTNAVHQLVLEQTIAGATDGLVGCRIFGSVYLVALQLEEFGIETGWSKNGPDTPTSPGAFIPTLIAALLDPLSQDSDTPRSLTHRFFCPGQSVFSAATVRESISVMAKFNPDGSDYSKELETTELGLAEKLAAWSGEGEPFWSLAEARCGSAVIIHIARAISRQVEQQTGMEWSFVTEQLRDLQAVQAEQRGRKLYLTTRLTSSQMSIYYRLGMPLPPLMLCDEVDDRHSAFDYAEADQIDDAFDVIWTSHAA